MKIKHNFAVGNQKKDGFSIERFFDIEKEADKYAKKHNLIVEKSTITTKI